MARVVIDLRSKECYEEGHLEEAFSFPWESIRDESCGLPPREVLLTAIIDEQVNQESAEAYLGRFRFASLEVRKLDAKEKLVREKPKGTCWSPNPFLSDIMPLIEAGGGGATLAVDVGSGTGRDMVFLASRGWNVVGIENRRRLIDQGIALSRKHGVTGRTLYIYCNLKEHYPVKPGSVDLLHVCRFLHRRSLSKLLELPRRGGHLIYSHFLDGCQKTDVGHPSSIAGFFLRGELRQLLASAGYAIVIEQETLLPDNRPFLNILARKE